MPSHHWSFSMSRQMAPVTELMLGCHIRVKNLTWWKIKHETARSWLQHSCWHIVISLLVGCRASQLKKKVTGEKVPPSEPEPGDLHSNTELQLHKQWNRSHFFDSDRSLCANIYHSLTCGVQDQSLPIKPIHHLPSHYYIQTYIIPKQYGTGSVLREV